MASLSIATPFGLIVGCKGQKLSRLVCSASSASPAKNQVTILQSLSRLLNFTQSAEDATADEEANAAAEEATVEADEPAPPRRLSKPVIFTEEKARLLRKATREGRTFHDQWYHSAIASRLAFPA